MTYCAAPTSSGASLVTSFAGAWVRMIVAVPPAPTARIMPKVAGSKFASLGEKPRRQVGVRAGRRGNDRGDGLALERHRLIGKRGQIKYHASGRNGHGQWESHVGLPFVLPHIGVPDG